MFALGSGARGSDIGSAKVGRPWFLDAPLTSVRSERVIVFWLLARYDARPPLRMRPKWLGLFLVALRTANVQAAELPVIELPPGESRDAWAETLAIAGLLAEVHGEGPWISVRVEGSTWRLVATDASGARREVVVNAPKIESDREDVAILAASLLRPVNMAAALSKRPAVPLPAPIPLPVAVVPLPPVVVAGEVRRPAPVVPVDVPTQPAEVPAPPTALLVASAGVATAPAEVQTVPAELPVVAADVSVVPTEVSSKPAEVPVPKAVPVATLTAAAPAELKPLPIPPVEEVAAPAATPESVTTLEVTPKPPLSPLWATLDIGGAVAVRSDAAAAADFSLGAGISWERVGLRAVGTWIAPAPLLSQGGRVTTGALVALAALDVRPLPRAGWQVSAGVGLASVSILRFDGESLAGPIFAPAGSVETGWWLPVGTRFSVEPLLRLGYLGRSIVLRRDDSPDVELSPFTVSVGATFRADIGENATQNVIRKGR